MSYGNRCSVISIRPEHARSWLVVRTKPRQERIAHQHLRQRDVEPYCPLFLEPPWHPRAPKGPVPMFTGYLFVRCDPRAQLNAVRYCPGVLQPVTFDGRLAHVGQEVIDAIRLREGDRGYVLPTEMEKGIAIGQRVRVMAGPLKGLEGAFRGYLRGGHRATILMDFLRSRKAIEVDTDVLAVIGA